MSIINEALKKAQVQTGEMKEQQESPVNKPVPRISPPPETKTHRNKPAILLWSVILVIFAGIATWSVFNKPRPVAPVAVVPAGVPQLVLNGIVYDKELPYAIVNNKMMTKGESISGATILEIYPDYVKFSFEGKEFEVRAQN